MVYLKSKEEIEKIGKAGHVTALVHQAIKEAIRPGISTYELDKIAEDIIKNEGAIPSFLHYRLGDLPPFPGSICASINEEVVHGIPSKTRILKEGDMISIDVGAKLNGYHGDMARTYPVGEVDKACADLIRVTKECFWKGFEQAVPGNRIGDISCAIASHAEAHGYAVIRVLIGHGVGKSLHEDPDVPNFGRKGHGMRLLPGLVIAIEPMINMGTPHVEVLEDQWTYVTGDRKPSSHYENTIAIGDDGPMVLTKVCR